PEGTTPAIVPPELWEAAQARLSTNIGAETRNAARPYLLRGHIVCGVCGRVMRASPEHGRRTYRCASRETPHGPCGAKRVPAEDPDGVEQWVWEQIDARLRDSSLIAAEIERQRAEGPDPGLVANREAVVRALAKVERHQERLLAQYGASEDDSF